MSPAEELREAARRMRELAEKATPGRWWAADVEDTEGTRWNEINADTPTDGVLLVVAGKAEPSIGKGDHLMAEDQLHIASWHPAVARAVADLLEQEADRLEEHLPQWRGDFWFPGAESGEPPVAYQNPEALNQLVEHHFGKALAVARAFLGAS